jgi:hypothetical protein
METSEPVGIAATAEKNTVRAMKNCMLDDVEGTSSFFVEMVKT